MASAGEHTPHTSSKIISGRGSAARVAGAHVYAGWPPDRPAPRDTPSGSTWVDSDRWCDEEIDDQRWARRHVEVQAGDQAVVAAASLDEVLHARDVAARLRSLTMNAATASSRKRYQRTYVTTPSCLRVIAAALLKPVTMRTSLDKVDVLQAAAVAVDGAPSVDLTAMTTDTESRNPRTALPRSR